MPHWLFHALLLYVVALLSAAIGVGIGSDARRWWRRRQRVQQARKRIAQTFRRGHG